ncbi:phosphohistidine phosphatase SixA [Sulfuriflexus sp.]|uniref:phosphohistidine phosphatase SixA n=1 Tax=Sulfuriflexus sp. TaxID=2015443 RepID=UPI0028CDB33C|nr:phosphohistidine phosphatase SixA [Sulfuriflexus sp.]MDT8404928.1 phosphohistidine phosphatase SixA [Sulfuriflexus sp.]
MKLYLVQHGEACTSEVDPSRPLTEQGKTDVNRLAVFLRKSGVRVDRIVHSGKLRARQTADRLVNAVAAGKVPETCDLLQPNDDPARFTQLSAAWTGDTLVVGHLPFVARLVSQLTLGNTRTLFADFTPGSAVCLERHADNRWTLNWMVRPEVLN